MAITKSGEFCSSRCGGRKLQTPSTGRHRRATWIFPSARRVASAEPAAALESQTWLETANFPRNEAVAKFNWKVYKNTMNASDLITVDPEILGGTPVFKGTRVPVKTLFEYIEDNYSLEEFLECFPSVTRDMACRVLERSESALLQPAAA